MWQKSNLYCHSVFWIFYYTVYFSNPLFTLHCIWPALTTGIDKRFSPRDLFWPFSVNPRDPSRSAFSEILRLPWQQQTCHVQSHLSHLSSPSDARFEHVFMHRHTPMWLADRDLRALEKVYLMKWPVSLYYIVKITDLTLAQTQCRFTSHSGCCSICS